MLLPLNGRIRREKSVRLQRFTHPHESVQLHALILTVTPRSFRDKSWAAVPAEKDILIDAVLSVASI